MHLSHTLRHELERRLALLDAEHREEPTARELPRGDNVWLALLLVAALIGVAVLQRS
jgi:hypothetical protein